MKRPILKVKNQAERLSKQLKYTRVTEDYSLTLKPHDLDTQLLINKKLIAVHHLFFRPSCQKLHLQ